MASNRKKIPLAIRDLVIQDYKIFIEIFEFYNINFLTNG